MSQKPLEIAVFMCFNMSMNMQAYSKIQLNGMTKEQLVNLYLNSYQSVKEEIDRKDEDISRLKELYAIQAQRKFGRSTEVAAGQQQFCFNEVEATIQDAGDIKEPTIEQAIKGYKRTVKRPKGKREADLQGIPVNVINVELPEDKLNEMFPSGYKRLPDQIYNKLRFVPAQFINDEYHIAVYRAVGKHVIVKADRPADLLKNSLATPEIVAAILNFKYVNSAPLYRLEQEFTRNGINISRQVMCSWVIRSSERYLSLVYDCMKKELLNCPVTHADETVVEVQKDGRKAGSESRLWIYASNANEGNPHTIYLYDYQKTRQAEHAINYLAGYSGVLVTDGYSGYHKLDSKVQSIRVAGCWVHARRGFAEVIKANPESAKGSVAEEAYEKITKIFHENNQFNGKTEEERLRGRQEIVKPKVDEFFKWASEILLHVPAKSKTGAALSYCLNQEQYLRVFLDYANVPMSNNFAEQGIRPITIGRKNWYVIDTVNGAEASAVCYSIAETAKANNLKPYEYFRYLLAEIPKHMNEHSRNNDFINCLMPWSADLPDYCRKPNTDK